MSNTIDQRVVEMRFDNRNFEQNVSHTMSTLDKFKAKLNLSDATKGFGNLSTAAKQVDMNGLASGVETVRARFSALEVIGVTALARITNQAMATGERMIKALTIDPIKTGFQEYETQINATQTILSNTKAKGSTIDDVNKALEELNKYADMTIYNFTEMTRNIGTFTAAGIDLDTSVNAIQGIANLAAVSGSTSQQASTAMYQLSQALASGTVKLMDWNSVVNAGMGGEMFQTALRETSELLGTGAEAAIKSAGSFRESLRNGWLTSEVLTETLKKFTTSGATEKVAEYTGLSKEAVDAALEAAKAQYGEADAIKYASKALAEKSGRNAKEIEDTLQFAQDATDAATKVKTFTQLWDVMKESAQSGWAQTWKIIVGDFEMAKNLLTPLADFFTGVINKMSDARNTLLQSALGKGFSHMFEGIDSVLNKVGKGVEAVLAPVDKASEALEKLDTVVNEVIGGSFGNGAERFRALTEAGQNYYLVQNKINEKLGSSVRHSEEKIKAQDELLKQQGKVTDAAEGEKKATIELNEENKNRLKQIAMMTEAEMKAAGYTEEQIDAMKELGKQAERIGLPLDEFIDNLDQINGRWLLINSFKNVGQGLVAVFTAMKDAWSEIFPPITEDHIFGIIAGLHKLTSYLRVNEDAADAFKRTFKGVFAALDIILTIVGGPIKIAFKLFAQLLEACNVNIFEVTAIVGDAIVKFHDWLDSVLDFTGVFKWLAPYVIEAYEAISKWANNIDWALTFETIAEYVSLLGEAIYKGVEAIKNNEIVQDVIAGFVRGFTDGAHAVWNAVVNFANTILEKIKEVLGIHSPSVEFYEIAQMCIEGLINGFKNSGESVFDVASKLGENLVKFFKNLDLGTILSTALSVGAVTALFKFSKSLDAVAALFSGAVKVFGSVDKILGSFARTLDGIADVAQGYGKKVKSEAFKNIAISIAILVAAVALLSFLDVKKVYASVGAIVILTAAMVALSWAIGKFGKGSSIDAIKFAVFAAAVSTALLMLVGVIKLIGMMDAGELEQAVVCFVVFGAVVAALIASTKLASDKDMKQIGGMIIKVAFAMMMLAIVAKLLGGMTWTAFAKAAIGIIGFVAIVAALITVSKYAKYNIGSIGKTILQISLAFLLLIAVSKIMAGMSWEDMARAAVGIVGLSAVIVALIAVTKLAGPNVDKIGTTLFKISGAIMMLSLAAKIIASMSWGDMAKAAVGITGLSIIVAGLIAATRLAGDKELKRVSTTLLTMTICIALLALISVTLGLMDIQMLAKGITAVSLLGAIISLMAYSVKGVGKARETIIALTIAIGVLAIAVTALTFVDPQKLAYATAAMTILISAFAALAVASGKSATAIGALIVLTVAIGLMAGILYILAKLPIESSIGAATSLGVLLLAVSGALLIMSKNSATLIEALRAVVALTAMTVPLAAFALVLSKIGNVQNGVQNAIALSLLIGAATLVLIPLSVIGTMAVNALIGVGLLTSMLLPMATFVYILSEMEGMDNAMSNVMALSILMVATSATLAILAVVGPAAMAAIPAIGALVILIAAIGGLIIGIGALMDSYPKLEEFLNKGIPVLDKLAHGIGSFVGNLFSGFADGLTDGLPEIGKKLSDFMVNAQSFIDGAKNIDDAVANGVTILAKAILALTAAEFINGMSSLISNGSGLADIGTDLSRFATNAAPFFYAMKNVDADVLIGIESLANALMALTAAKVVNGLTSWFTGDVSLADFGKQLEEFGPSMRRYAAAVSGMDSESVKASAEAATVLADMAGSLPNSGGLSGLLSGENDMGVFGEQLVAFGKSLKIYSLCVAGMNAEAVTLSAEAAKGLGEMATTLPNFGGMVSFFTGDNDLVTFGAQLAEFGKSIRIYSITVSGINADSIELSVNAASKLSEMATALPNYGGMVAWFSGDNDITTFGAQLIIFGSSLKQYASTVAGLDAEAVELSVTAATSLSKLAKELPESGGFWSIFSADNDMSTFSNEIVSFGYGLMNYSNAVAGIDASSVSYSILAANKIISLLKGMDGVDFVNASRFKSALETLGSASVDKFISSFKGSTDKLNHVGQNMINSITRGIAEARPKMLSVTEDLIEYTHRAIERQNSSFKLSGMTLVTQLILGMRLQTSSITVTIITLSLAAITAIRNQYSNFYAAGSYLVTGFSKGITANTYKAEAASRAMAIAALDAAKEALGVQSPSKEFYAVGEYSGLGFINALFAYAKKAYNAGAEMGDSATSGVADAIARIKYALDENVDIQPTISPVLDLSDIKNGANAINGLLDGTPLNASLGSISTAMNRRNQNGTTNDVVYAINKLRKDLSELDRNSYNIGNVSYEEGSDVANAIQTLVRAAVRERRV